MYLVILSLKILSVAFIFHLVNADKTANGCVLSEIFNNQGFKFPCERMTVIEPTQTQATEEPNQSVSAESCSTLFSWKLKSFQRPRCVRFWPNYSKSIRGNTDNELGTVIHISLTDILTKTFPTVGTFYLTEIDSLIRYLFSFKFSNKPNLYEMLSKLFKT